MKEIYTEIGCCIAICHCVESSVFEMCSILSALHVVEAKQKQNGGDILEENELDPILAAEKSKYKKKSHHDRINELHRLAPNLITTQDVEILHSAREARNSMSHNYISENAGLMFTRSKRAKILSELGEYRAKLQHASSLALDRHESLVQICKVNIERFWNEFLIEVHTDTQ